jgi:hypothetical protein
MKNAQMANQQQCPNAQKSLVFCSIIPPILQNEFGNAHLQ